MSDPPVSNLFLDVAVPLPLFTTFTYTAPPELAGALQVGVRVLVPFGQRRLTGYVIGLISAPPRQGLKPICDILDEEPVFSRADLEFYSWVSSYYYYPLGQTIKTALPQGLNTEYRHAACITPAGSDLLSAGSLGRQETLVLQNLAGRGEVTLKQLEKNAGRTGLHQTVRSLRDRGLVGFVLKKTGSGTGIKKEKWFSLSAEALPKPRSEKQKEILAWIAAGEPRSMSSLRKHFGSCAAQLNTLQKKGLVTSQEREIFRRPPDLETVFTEPLHDLTPEQNDVVKRVQKAIDSRAFEPFLLHGVTGSGKTEVYLQVMERVLTQGRQCLYLVPEIALTSQLWDRITSRLTAPIAMLHSSLTSAERYDAWRMIRRGDVRVVIGARSSIFAPFADLGAIIVDEEHDPSYKQDDALRYNARDLALLRGRSSKSAVVLGSATPSLESYQNALEKKYTSVTLTRRVEHKTLPRITTIDLRREGARQRKETGLLSKALYNAVARRLAEAEQALLFLNRRGFSPAYICKQCGHTFTCPNCAVSLIHHRSKKKLCCHYCDRSVPVPEQCPQCSSYFLTPMGWGTERLEAEIRHLFPAARVARMDRDTTADSGASRSILKQVHRREIDILIGTQMVVKGYHLPGITLVGVLCADQSLNFPDYRASERTFQLLTQVAGRAGRGDVPGEVIIQTYNPGHYSITCAQQHDYKTFYRTELAHRRSLGYPPFTRMINLRFEGTSRRQVEGCARIVGRAAEALLPGYGPPRPVEVLGPARSPWEKIKNRYRYQMLLKSAGTQKLHAFVTEILDQSRPQIRKSGVRVIVDVDPMFTM